MAKFLVVVLEGDQRQHLAEVVRLAGFEPIGTVRLASDWESVTYRADEPGCLVAGVADGWTVLVDAHTVTWAVFANAGLGDQLANQLGVRVVTACSDTVCGIFGYRFYSKNGVRSVLLEQGSILEDEGRPLPGEETDLDFLDPETILETLELWGIDLVDAVDETDRTAWLRYRDPTT